MELTSPSDLIINLARGYFAPRCLYLIAELGVADHIGDAPCPLNELAEKTATDPNSFARVLDLLETIGVFERNGDGYQHTAASRLLRSDNPNSLRSFVRMIGSEMCWSCFGSLMHSVQSGAPTLTQGLFGYLSANPEMGKVFDEAMTGKSRQEIAALVSAYDFSGFDVIADVGGGQGHLLQAVLTVAPKARGILFDLPQVVDQEIASARLSIQSGDFFKDQIPQADVYLVSRVVHDWPDEQATAIFSNIRRAMSATGKLLVIENVIFEGPHARRTRELDILMLAVSGGRERTRAQYEELLSAAGLRISRIVPTGDSISIIEATSTDGATG